MHPLFLQASSLTEQAIGAAIEVHRHFGPGLLESVYEWAFAREMELCGFGCATQQVVRIHYKGFEREEPLKFDLLVDNCLLIEVKAVESIAPIHKAQLLSYMKLLDVPLGLLINFHEEKLIDGVSRMMLSGTNRKA